MPASTKTRLGLRFAAWLSLILGLYGIVAVASLVGLLAGGFAGAMKTMISLAVLTDRPDSRTTRIVKSGLVLSALALSACVAVLLAVWLL